MSARLLCLAAISIVLINNCNYPEEYSAQAKVNTKVLTIYEEPNPYAREVGYVKEGETVRLTSRTFGRQIIDYQQSYWYPESVIPDSFSGDRVTFMYRNGVFRR